MQEYFAYRGSKELLDLIDRAGQRAGVGRSRAFSDWLEMCICALSGGCMEDRYLEIIKPYGGGKRTAKGRLYDDSRRAIDDLADAFGCLVRHTEKTLEDFSVRWGVGVLGLEQVWDLRVREIEDRLRALYDEEDYPSWERVRGCFDVRWNYFTMNTPQVLQAVSAKLFTREQAKATVQWNEMLDEIRDGLRLTFKERIRSVNCVIEGAGAREHR